MIYEGTNEKFIITALACGLDVNEYVVVRQTHKIFMWIRKGYIKCQMDNPLEEYTYVSISLTELGKSILDFDKL